MLTKTKNCFDVTLVASGNEDQVACKICTLTEDGQRTMFRIHAIGDSGDSTYVLDYEGVGIVYRDGVPTWSMIVDVMNNAISYISYQATDLDGDDLRWILHFNAAGSVRLLIEVEVIPFVS